MKVFVEDRYHCVGVRWIQHLAAATWSGDSQAQDHIVDEVVESGQKTGGCAL